MKSALTIAGSDCSGGAGIQADLKAFSANGVFGQSAITALVDENTKGVYGIYKVPPQFVADQMKSCCNDIGADAIKIGMLDDTAVSLKVKETLLSLENCPGVNNIVLDPVMVSTSGHKLLEDSAIEVLKTELIPLVRVITPNLPEAEILLNKKFGASEFETSAKELSKLGTTKPLSVLLKAGHLCDDVLVDYFYNAETNEILKLPSTKVETKNTHGTGCTLSSAIAAQLAQGKSLNEAVIQGKKYIEMAIIAAKNLELGGGHGPVHHFYKWY